MTKSNRFSHRPSTGKEWQPEAPQSSLFELTLSPRPGHKLGLAFDPNTGRVNQVAHNSEAFLAGVQMGWFMRKINGCDFSRARMVECASSGRSFVVTFDISQAEPSISIEPQMRMPYPIGPVTPSQPCLPRMQKPPVTWIPVDDSASSASKSEACPLIADFNKEIPTIAEDPALACMLPDKLTDDDQVMSWPETPPNFGMPPQQFFFYDLQESLSRAVLTVPKCAMKNALDDTTDPLPSPTCSTKSGSTTRTEKSSSPHPSCSSGSAPDPQTPCVVILMRRGVYDAFQFPEDATDDDVSNFDKLRNAQGQRSQSCPAACRLNVGCDLDSSEAKMQVSPKSHKRIPSISTISPDTESNVDNISAPYDIESSAEGNLSQELNGFETLLLDSSVVPEQQRDADAAETTPEAPTKDLHEVVSAAGLVSGSACLPPPQTEEESYVEQKPSPQAQPQQEKLSQPSSPVRSKKQKKGTKQAEEKKHQQQQQEQEVDAAKAPPVAEKPLAQKSAGIKDDTAPMQQCEAKATTSSKESKDSATEKKSQDKKGITCETDCKKAETICKKERAAKNNKAKKEKESEKHDSSASSQKSQCEEISSVSSSKAKSSPLAGPKNSQKSNEKQVSDMPEKSDSTSTSLLRRSTDVLDQKASEKSSGSSETKAPKIPVSKSAVVSGNKDLPYVEKQRKAAADQEAFSKTLLNMPCVRFEDHSSQVEELSKTLAALAKEAHQNEKVRNQPATSSDAHKQRSGKKRLSEASRSVSDSQAKLDSSAAADDVLTRLTNMLLGEGHRTSQVSTIVAVGFFAMVVINILDISQIQSIAAIGVLALSLFLLTSVLAPRQPRLWAILVVGMLCMFFVGQGGLTSPSEQAISSKDSLSSVRHSQRASASETAGLPLKAKQRFADVPQKTKLSEASPFADDQSIKDLSTGSKVVVTKSFVADGKSRMRLTEGHVGHVKRLDKVGDALVHFEGVKMNQWVARHNFDKLQLIEVE